MTSRAKRVGSQFERDCVEVLRAAGFDEAERRYGAGAQADKGDIRGVPSTVIECKSLAKITLSTILDETEAERVNANAKWGIAVIKRRGRHARDAYAVMRFEDLARLLRQFHGG